MDALGLERVTREFGIELILEFGSMVTGHVHARSDLDLAILLGRPALSFATWPTSDMNCTYSTPITKWMWQSSITPILCAESLAYR